MAAVTAPPRRLSPPRQNRWAEWKQLQPGPFGIHAEMKLSNASGPRTDFLMCESCAVFTDMFCLHFWTSLTQRLSLLFSLHWRGGGGGGCWSFCLEINWLKSAKPTWWWLMWREGEKVGIAGVRAGGWRGGSFPNERAGFRPPRLQSRHNYSISMLSCASVFLYSSNSSQLTRHMRPSAKEPVRAPLCPQPPTAPLPCSHWLSAVAGIQGQSPRHHGRAASALVSPVGIDKTLAQRVNPQQIMKTSLWPKICLSERKKRIFIYFFSLIHSMRFYCGLAQGRLCNYNW